MKNQSVHSKEVTNFFELDIYSWHKCCEIFIRIEQSGIVRK
jgi:hypothetical protein